MKYLLICLFLCGCSLSFEVLNTATSQDENGELTEAVDANDTLEAEADVDVTTTSN